MANTDKVFERILAADRNSRTAPPVEATSETVTAACGFCAHHKEGYALGIQHATEEMAVARSRRGSAGTDRAADDGGRGDGGVHEMDGPAVGVLPV